MVNTLSSRSFPTLYEIADVSYRKIEIPVGKEDDYPYFVLHQAVDIRKYYDQNGDVVVHGLLPPELCDRARTGFERYGKTTRRAVFLAEMEQVVPWPALCGLIDPVYPKPGNGRPPIGSSGCCASTSRSNGSICRIRR